MFLTSMNNQALFLLICLYLFVVSILYFLVIGLLYLLKLKSFYTTWYKKIFLFLGIGVIAYFILFFWQKLYN